MIDVPPRRGRSGTFFRRRMSRTFGMFGMQRVASYAATLGLVGGGSGGQCRCRDPGWDGSPGSLLIQDQGSDENPRAAFPEADITSPEIRLEMGDGGCDSVSGS